MTIEPRSQPEVSNFAKYIEVENANSTLLTITSFSIAAMDSIPIDTTIPTPHSAVTKFVSDLPILDTASLRDEQKTCHICMESFTSEFVQDLPILLPCGHIFGKNCVVKWLTSDGDKSPRSCPMCRAELLPQLQLPSLEPFWDQLREIESLRLLVVTVPSETGVQHLPGERGEAGHAFGNRMMAADENSRNASSDPFRGPGG